MGRTALLPVAVGFVLVLPLAGVTLWALLLLLLPLAAAAWVLRVGVDVSDAGVTARSVVSARTVGWPELSGIRVGEGRELWLVTTTGSQVRLPVLRARDLPQLAALSGGRIPDPGTPTAR
ncbi:PH domain-containing protein [Modestobacter sp. L9-4]|nr:PH domain-containing protein [Modestobacter sp. L9-4]